MTLIYGAGNVGTGGGMVTPPTYASTFSVTLSDASGQAGTTRTATVTPIGTWTPGQPVALSVTGASISPDSRTGSGTTPVTFSFTPTGPGTLSVDAIAAGMTSTGAQTYTVTSAPIVITPSNTATRIDVVFDQSAVAPGATVTGSFVPNGPWPITTGNTATLTPTSGAAITVNLPSTGRAPATFSFAAPSIGDDYFTVTNTAGLANPWQPQINVFAAASGTSQTFAAALAGTLPDLRSFQRDAASGSPTGFSSSWTRGWASVAINITSLSGSTSGVWARLHDAMSSGATSTAGTGTMLQAPVQVHGALGASGTIAPMLPAGPYFYYVDLATDAAFTSPVRVPQRFSVGVTVAMMTRSQEAGFANPYADGTSFAQIYGKLATWTSGDYRYPADAYTGIHWGLSTNTSAGQEFARIIEAQLGVVVGVTGVAATGGGLDEYIAHDGTPRNAFDATVATSVNRKFRYFILDMSDWGDNGPAESAYPTETFAEDQARMLGTVAKIPQIYPACAVIRWNSGASGWFGNNGSADLGYTRIAGVARALETANPIVVSGESTLWNEFVGGHASQGARPDYARTAARMILAAEPAAMGGLGTSTRGPTLAAAGTLSGRTIVLTYALHGGSTLISVGATYTNPTVAYDTASPSELAALFSVYAGAGGRSGTGLPIQIATATVNTSAATISLLLTGSSGVTYSDGSAGAMPSVFNVHYGADFGASAARLPDGRGASLCDDVNEFGIPYGRLMRPALDIAVS